MEKTAKKQDTAPVMTVEIDDASIPSILDTGFVRDYAVTSYLHSHSYYERSPPWKPRCIWKEPTMSNGRCLPVRSA